ncbi:MAG TPA: tetratricopeptide repeat protein [Candidatus Acidoferrales bacterium]|nr:tetratricopeptide repeat protein [Candidatus Acidoferrales bacterium]
MISASDTSRTAIERATRLLLRGEHERAREILGAAVERDPRNGALQARTGDALYQGERVAEAREAYRRAIALDEGEFQAWYGCGVAEYSLEAFAAASGCLQHAAELEPSDAEVRVWLGKAVFEMGEIEAAIRELQIAAKSRDRTTRGRALCLIAMMIPGSPRHGNAEVLRARKRWAEFAAKEERSGRPHARRIAKTRAKLRIGYVSSYFHHRNWMKPVWGVINSHDRDAFEIHLFANGGMPSAEGGYAGNSGDLVHEITGLSNHEAARKIAAAGIDVLVDLNGYSDPLRPRMFIRRPAPVVMGWFNMFATTGIREFDYIVGDASVIPPEEERFYRERVLRVSGSYLAFRVLYPVPPIAAPPCLETERITFGCFAPQYKITGEMIATWACILKRAPGARLLLKSQCLRDAGNREAVHARFARQGIAPERVALELPEEHYEFLRAYDRVDIALDSFPYNGGTTTMEALWQGVPVLAVDGDRWVSRTSKSLLLAAGMGDWVMPSIEGYVQRAIELANSKETAAMLKELRAGMREWLIVSKACDAEGLCRELEEHFRNTAEISGEQGRSRRSGPRIRRNNPRC